MASQELSVISHTEKVLPRNKVLFDGALIWGVSPVALGRGFPSKMGTLRYIQITEWNAASIEGSYYITSSRWEAEDSCDNNVALFKSLYFTSLLSLQVLLLSLVMACWTPWVPPAGGKCDGNSHCLTGQVQTILDLVVETLWASATCNYFHGYLLIPWKISSKMQPIKRNKEDVLLTWAGQFQKDLTLQCDHSIWTIPVSLAYTKASSLFLQCCKKMPNILPKIPYPS